MEILIADDEAVSRHLLALALQPLGCDVIACSNGLDALAHLEREDPPRLAILDWMMPGMDGPSICGRVHERPESAKPVYLILLTAKMEPEAVVAGLEAGAADFVTKPFNPEELRARVRVGLRMIELQETLADRVRELQSALSRVKQLQGLLPICAYCKKIRDDQNYWTRVEGYISNHADVQFSHGICPECFSRVMKELDGAG